MTTVNTWAHAHGGTWGSEYDDELCGNEQTDCGDWDDKRMAYSSLSPSPAGTPPSPAPRLNQRDAAGFMVVVIELVASPPFACSAVLTFPDSFCPIAITSFYGNKV